MAKSSDTDMMLGTGRIKTWSSDAQAGQGRDNVDEAMAIAIARGLVKVGAVQASYAPAGGALRRVNSALTT